MATTIIAGDASNGASISSDTTGALVLQTGAAGSKVNAVSIAADGTPTFLLTPRATGSILQMLVTSDAGASTASTSFVSVSTANQSITPKSTTSRIIVECSFNAGIANFAATNTTGTFQLYDATNSTLIGTAQLIQAPSGGGGTGSVGGMNLKWFVNNTALTTRQFIIHGKTNNASALASSSACVWTLTEVQN